MLFMNHIVEINLRVRRANQRREVATTRVREQGGGWEMNSETSRNLK